MTIATHYEYDVALSFAGEDRSYADQLAECLTKKNVCVFYDKYEQAELWGKDLYEHLASIYKDKAYYCVMFISHYYASKLWTTHERKNAQARAFNESREYILPLRLDDTEIPGLPPTIGYLDLRKTPIAKVCDLVLQKLSSPVASQSELSKVMASVRPVGTWASDSIVIGNLSIARVLTGSTGDLEFIIDASSVDVWDTIAIYMPPGFRLPSVQSQMQEDRPRIRVSRASPFDPYGPQWNVIYIPADTITYGDTAVGSHAFLNPIIEVTSNKECYNIRIKGTTAPSIGGRYMFKVALLTIESYGIGGEDGNGSTRLGHFSSRFIPPSNWPMLLVKGEVEPAEIAGTIRRASNKTLIAEAGRVLAHMIERIDPYTEKQRSDLPTIDAVGYFTATDEGRYEVSGLAPGVYDLYVSAAGFPQTLGAPGLTILRGQALHVDCYLEPGQVIYGQLSSDGSWSDNAYAKIEIYEAPTLSLRPDPSARLVSWSPSRVRPRQKVFGSMKGAQDVGATQLWQVQGGTTNPFHFEFGEKEKYGAPRDFDGMVPQLYATWVNGLTTGRYYARGWVSRYDQSTQNGVTFMEYYFDIMPKMRDDVNLTIRLHGA